MERWSSNSRSCCFQKQSQFHQVQYMSKQRHCKKHKYKSHLILHWYMFFLETHKFVHKRHWRIENNSCCCQKQWWNRRDQCKKNKRRQNNLSECRIHSKHHWYTFFVEIGRSFHKEHSK